MPIFEYVCKACDHQFEALVYGKQKAECPKCHGHKLAPQLSVFAVSAKGSLDSRAVNRRLAAPVATLAGPDPARFPTEPSFPKQIPPLSLAALASVGMTMFIFTTIARQGARRCNCLPIR